MNENLHLISPQFKSSSFKYTALRFSDDSELICIFSVYENKEITKDDSDWEKALEYVTARQLTPKLDAEE